MGAGSDFGAWTLARLLAGVSETTLDLDDLAETWRSLADAVVMRADGQKPVDAFFVELERHPDLDAGAIINAVWAIDPSVPLSLEEPELGEVLSSEVLTLPDAARLPDAALAQAEQVGNWLRTYVDYAGERSPMTPRLFHEAGGLWLGSVAIARRLYCRLPHADIWPNLYILWVADPSLFAKSTALDIVEELAHDALNHLLLPQEFTPEALLSELAGKDPPSLDDMAQDIRDLWQVRRNFAAQRGLILEEFSGILASARKDYNAGLTEHVLRLFDCPKQWAKRTQGSGLVLVRSAYVSLLAATTPEALGPYLSQHAWLSGFWPRFALLSPEEERPAFRRTDFRPNRPASLVEDLTRLACHNLPTPTFPTPPQAKGVVLSDDARDAWKRYDKAMRYDLLTEALEKPLWGLYGRLPTQAIKVAIILAALDWQSGEEPVIAPSHWARAQEIVESWRGSAHRLLIPAQVKAEEQQERRVLSVIHRSGKATARDVYRATGMSHDEAEYILERLVRDGLLEAEKPAEQRRGPKTIYYRIP